MSIGIKRGKRGSVPQKGSAFLILEHSKKEKKGKEKQSAFSI